MKRISYFMALAMFLAFACQRNELQEDVRPEARSSFKTLTVGVADETGTRVGFDEDNSFYWHGGDRIGVLTVNGFKEMTVGDEYHGQSTGVFTGDFEEEIGDYVVYPHGAHMMGDGQLTYVLPSSYTYDSIEDEANSFNPPMIGRIDGANATLTHLASFFKISVNNIPAGGDDMKFVFTADKRITGEFLVDLSADTPVIETDDSEGNTVTISFSNTVPGNSGAFYVPVPLGTYGSVTAEIKDGDESLLSKTWTGQTVSRRTPKRGTTVLDYVAEINGVPYQTLQAAFDAASGQTITLVKDLRLDAPLVFASGRTAVLDLNGKTISDTSTSAATSYLLAVKSGADLTVKNGRLEFAATTPDTQWGEDGLPDYPGYANNTVRNEGTLTVDNAVLENMTKKGGASYVVDNYSGAKLIVNEGSVLNQLGGDIAVRMFNGGSGTIDVTVNGGTISGYRAVWIQLASTNTSVAPVMNLTVGGTLTSRDATYNQAVYSYSYGNDMKNVSINVSGGTFLEDPTDYLAEGYEAVLTDGIWTVRPASE